MSENNKDENKSITNLRVDKITSTHSDAQNKLREILLKKKMEFSAPANDDEPSL